MTTASLPASALMAELSLLSELRGGVRAYGGDKPRSRSPPFAFSDTINHAAPTLCKKVPMSEMTSAANRFRKIGTRSGRRKLEGFMATLAYTDSTSPIGNPLLKSGFAAPSPCALRHRLTRSCDISEL
jgi:hypothetical protein